MDTSNEAAKNRYERAAEAARNRIRPDSRVADEAKKIDDRVENYLNYSGLSSDEEKALRDKINNAQTVQEQLDIINADELDKEKERIKAFITGRRKH